MAWTIGGAESQSVLANVRLILQTEVGGIGRDVCRVLLGALGDVSVAVLIVDIVLYLAVYVREIGSH